MKKFRLVRETNFRIKKSRIPESCVWLGFDFVNEDQEKYLVLYLFKWYIAIGFMFENWM